MGKVEGTSRPECVVCSQRKDKDHPNGKRHQTQFTCKTCQKAMCPYPCFERYTPSGCTEFNAQKNCMTINLLDCKVFRGKMNRHRVK